MNEQVTIYALCDDTGVKYVGQTRLTPEQRLRAHWARRKWDGSAKAKWLCALEEAGAMPMVVVLEVVGQAEADEAEMRQIAAHRAKGCLLVNGSPGYQRHRETRTEGKRHQVLRTVPLEMWATLRAEAQNRTVAPAIAARMLLVERLDQLAARAAAVPAAPALTQEAQP